MKTGEIFVTILTKVWNSKCYQLVLNAFKLPIVPTVYKFILSHNHSNTKCFLCSIAHKEI